MNYENLDSTGRAGDSLQIIQLASRSTTVIPAMTATWWF